MHARRLRLCGRTAATAWTYSEPMQRARVSMHERRLQVAPPAASHVARHALAPPQAGPAEGDQPGPASVAVAGCGCSVLCPPAHVSPRRKAQWLTDTVAACAGSIRGRCARARRHEPGMGPGQHQFSWVRLQPVDVTRPRPLHVTDRPGAATRARWAMAGELDDGAEDHALQQAGGHWPHTATRRREESAAGHGARPHARSAPAAKQKQSP